MMPLKEFEKYADSLTNLSGKLLILGDFNIHMDIITDSNANKMKDLLHSLHRPHPLFNLQLLLQQ